MADHRQDHARAATATATLEVAGLLRGGQSNVVTAPKGALARQPGRHREANQAFVARAPSPALAPLVDRVGYYEIQDPGGREVVVPTGSMALIVNLARDQARWHNADGVATVHTRRGAAVLGASAGRIGANFADWRAGAFVAFRPGGAYPFFGPPASAIDEPLVELEALWGRDGAVLRERLLEAPTVEVLLATLEAALLARAVRPLVGDPAVVAGTAMLGRGATVTEVADRLGWTDRTLLRRFREHVGLTPKRFARIRRLHKRLAYVPGEVTLWPGLSGDEVIDLLGRMRGGLDTTRRDELLERFDLDPRKKGRTYSKGNKQKVGLVAALASDVELLLLDEPTSGLDPLMEEIFQQCIQEERQRGRTILLSSHILAEVEALCDRVTIIRLGRAVETGTLAEMRHLTRTSLCADLASAPDGLGGIAGVHDLQVDGTRVRCEVDSDDLNAVLRQLTSLGVRSLISQPPTLEELFLRHYRDERDTRAQEVSR